MQRVDEFVNSMYKGFDINDHDVQELKNEMKTHLLDTVKDLETQGISEDESIKIAVERFGDKKQLNTGLLEFFSYQKRFAKNLLRICLSCLVIGSVSWISLFIMESNYHTTASTTTSSIINGISTLLAHEDQISIENENKINSLVQKYPKVHNVAIFTVVKAVKVVKVVTNHTVTVEEQKLAENQQLKEQKIAEEFYYPSNYQLSDAIFSYQKKVDLVDNQYVTTGNIDRINNRVIQIQYPNNDWMREYWKIPNYLFIIFGVLFTVWFGITIGQTRYIKNRTTKIAKREILGLSMGSMFFFILAGMSYDCVGVPSGDVFGILGITFIILIVWQVIQRGMKGFFS